MLRNVWSDNVLQVFKRVTEPAFQSRVQTRRANLWVLSRRAASCEEGGGSQTEEQYVKWGRMRDLYNFMSDEVGAWGWNERKINATSFLTREQMFWM